MCLISLFFSSRNGLRGIDCLIKKIDMCFTFQNYVPLLCEICYYHLLKIYFNNIYFNYCVLF